MYKILIVDNLSSDQQDWRGSITEKWVVVLYSYKRAGLSDFGGGG